MWLTGFEPIKRRNHPALYKCNILFESRVKGKNPGAYNKKYYCCVSSIVFNLTSTQTQKAPANAGALFFVLFCDRNTDDTDVTLTFHFLAILPSYEFSK